MSEQDRLDPDVDEACLALVALIEAKLNLRVWKLTHPEDLGDVEAETVARADRRFGNCHPTARIAARARITRLANE